jgi:hypothetical protein
MDYEALLDWFRSMMNEMDPDKVAARRKIKLRFAKGVRPLVPLGHIERILENVNHAVAGDGPEEGVRAIAVPCGGLQKAHF